LRFWNIICLTLDLNSFLSKIVWTSLGNLLNINIVV
jgi:hypothetical protein